MCANALDCCRWHVFVFKTENPPIAFPGFGFRVKPFQGPAKRAGWVAYFKICSAEGVANEAIRSDLGTFDKIPCRRDSGRAGLMQDGAKLRVQHSFCFFRPLSTFCHRLFGGLVGFSQSV